MRNLIKFKCCPCANFSSICCSFTTICCSLSCLTNHIPLNTSHIGRMPLFLLLLLLASTCSSLHIFLSHSSSHVYTRQSFSLLLDGDDCPYTPCYFAVFLNGTEHSTGLYQNTVKRVSVTVTIPGQVSR